MLDYSAEAAVYDATRGGEPRAQAAADAILTLIPGDARTLLDIACGTALVTRRLAARTGLRVTGLDLAPGMLGVAAARLGGAVVRGDSRRLPFANGSQDAVTTIWLLHLLDDAAPVVAEAARVLRPGGVFVTTVDKAAAHEVDSDIDELVAPYRRAHASDAAELVTSYVAAHGLRPAGEARFRGHGQGRTPCRLAGQVRTGRVYAAGGTALADALETLPRQDEPRPEPEFTLRAYRKPDVA